MQISVLLFFKCRVYTFSDSSFPALPWSFYTFNGSWISLSFQRQSQFLDLFSKKLGCHLPTVNHIAAKKTDVCSNGIALFHSTVLRVKEYRYILWPQAFTTHHKEFWFITDFRQVGSPWTCLTWPFYLLGLSLFVFLLVMDSFSYFTAFKEFLSVSLWYEQTRADCQTVYT